MNGFKMVVAFVAAFISLVFAVFAVAFAAAIVVKAFVFACDALNCTAVD